MKKCVFLLLVIGLLLSCEKNEVNPSDIKQLAYGTFLWNVCWLL